MFCVSAFNRDNRGQTKYFYRSKLYIYNTEDEQIEGFSIDEHVENLQIYYTRLNNHVKPALSRSANNKIKMLTLWECCLSTINRRAKTLSLFVARYSLTPNIKLFEIINRTDDDNKMCSRLKSIYFGNSAPIFDLDEKEEDLLQFFDCVDEFTDNIKPEMKRTLKDYEEMMTHLREQINKKVDKTADTHSVIPQTTELSHEKDLDSNPDTEEVDFQIDQEISPDTFDANLADGGVKANTGAALDKLSLERNISKKTPKGFFSKLEKIKWYLLFVGMLFIISIGIVIFAYIKENK